MPKIIDCVQNTPEWFYARMGVPTSSCFHRVLTPKKLELSKQADEYMYFLLSEMMVGHPITGTETDWMRRGQDEQDNCIAAYEFEKEVETAPVGFVTNDAGTIGASPDRLVGEDGIFEAKSPKETTQMRYLITGEAEEDYFLQLQGQLLVTGRQWVDIGSWHPEMPLSVIRVTRKEEYISKMAEELDKFVARIDAAKAALIERFGPFVRRQPPVEEPPVGSQFDVGPADIDRIWNRVQKERGE